MSGTIQFINYSPDELLAEVDKRLIKHRESIVREFQPKEPTEFLTRNEVSQLLKIDLSSVHNWTKKGKLIAYGISGRVYYKRAEVESAMVKLNQD